MASAQEVMNSPIAEGSNVSQVASSASAVAHDMGIFDTSYWREKAYDNYLSNLRTQEEREWEERMSNTAIQRQMADLKAAGINPLLAANYGGASSPSVAAAPISSASSVEQRMNYQIKKKNADTARLGVILGFIASLIGSAAKMG